MKIGIVGLPQSGKTTLFSALTGQQVDIEGFVGGKKDAHQAIVKVPDDRLEQLNEIYKPKKKTLATVDYVDLSGLGTSTQKKGAFSDQFLAQIRIVDAILIIVRVFKNAQVIHPLETIDPGRDLDHVQAEFILADLSIIENRMDRLERQMKSKKNEQDMREFELLQRFKDTLENEIPLRQLELSSNEELMVRGYQFLTLKPLLIVPNIDEDQISDTEAVINDLSEWQESQTRLVPISAQIEMEMQQLSESEAEVFRDDLGITHSAMDVLIRASYDLLGLISFFTVGEDEVRAWTVRNGTKAPEAAGEIHSDIERGFIRAEVVHYDEFIKRKSLAVCRTDGVLRLEGREYTVSDGDIINFRFAV
jgi:hypothetical protein